jgi:hypothetical protein
MNDGQSTTEHKQMREKDETQSLRGKEPKKKEDRECLRVWFVRHLHYSKSRNPSTKPFSFPDAALIVDARGREVGGKCLNG